jgi:hypothetical protein
MALTADLTPVDTRSAEVSLRGVESPTADSLAKLGNLGFAVQEGALKAGAQRDFEEVRDGFVQPEKLAKDAELRKQVANETITQAEYEVSRKKLQLDQGVMSASQFKAETFLILKKYQAMAPGLTAEFSSVARSVLGRDPFADMVNDTIRARAAANTDNATSKVLSEFRKMYHSEMLADSQVPETGLTVEQMQAELRPIAVRKQKQADIENRKNQLVEDQSEQTQLAREDSGMIMENVQRLAKAELDKIRNGEGTDAEKGVAMSKYLKDQANEFVVQMQSQKAYSKIDVNDVAKPMVDLLNSWSEDVLGVGIEKFNRLDDSNRKAAGRIKLFGSMDGAGYEMLAVAEQGGFGAEMTGLIINMFMESQGLSYGPSSDLFKELRASKGLPPLNITPTAEGDSSTVSEFNEKYKGGISKGSKAIVDFVTENLPKQLDNIKQIISGKVALPLLEEFDNMKKKIGRMSEQDLRVNTDARRKFDLMTADLVNMYQTIGFDKVKGDDLSVLRTAVSMSEEGAKDSLRLLVGDKPMFEVHIDGDGVRVKRNNPVGTGSFPVISEASQKAQNIVVPDFTKQMNSIFQYYKNVEGWNADEFVEYMTENKIPKQVKEEDLVKGELTDKDFLETTPNDIERASPLEKVEDGTYMINDKLVEVINGKIVDPASE